jgi:hypothetical protein
LEKDGAMEVHQGTVDQIKLLIHYEYFLKNIIILKGLLLNRAKNAISGLKSWEPLKNVKTDEAHIQA